jgi:D-alanyl-D-alanine carboxypeptidase/D-alanyl-D-alanine-endopeptidase (penicillin-binding protein 4)
LNSRKPIFAILAAGLVTILALTFTPYALLSRAKHAVASAVRPAPDTEALKELERQKAATASLPPFDVASWYVGRGANPETHAVLIESLDGAQVFAAHNADITYNPASLVKLTTSLAALRQLGKDFRFETRVYVDGTIDNAGVLRGRLLIAGGDPTFGDIAAGMIAKKLEERGIKRVPEEIVVSPDFTFNYSEKPEESAERLARVMKLSPKKFSVADAPTTHPTFILRSYPLREILLYMNAHSSNFVAERLGGLVGGPEGVRRFLLNELQLPAEQVSLSTTSGLEQNRMTARGLLKVIRALNAEANRQGMKLEDIMAVASDDWGTLRRRLVGTPLEGAAVGKTGTLVHDDGGMSSLGGIVYTQKTGAVCFVIFNQGSTVAENKQMTDQLLVEIILANDLPAVIPKPEERRHMLERTDLVIEEQ